MTLKNISLRRHPLSYGKVQMAIGTVVRNRERFLDAERLQKAYADLGSGPNIHDNFVNIDYVWRPGLDVCWDITRGVPLPDNSMKGVFTEHCLEYFPLETADKILAESKHILQPGGALRVIVPDAELYLRTYYERMGGATDECFPYEEDDKYDGLYSPLLSVNRIYYVQRESPAGHQCMFDFALMSQLLEKNGFSNITRCSFGQGRDPVLLIDSPFREVESLYVEASA